MKIDIYHLRYLRWHSTDSTVNWNIAMLTFTLTAAMIHLHLFKFGELQSSSPRNHKARMCTVGI